mmetsp:Transcript_16264/g.29501  ORF Transcript_16264/g.29501 Transcript_16264/m.29501 type:complete len:91 (+) Transcript_16264:502-774(+)
MPLGSTVSIGMEDALTISTSQPRPSRTPLISSGVRGGSAAAASPPPLILLRRLEKEDGISIWRHIVLDELCCIDELYLLMTKSLCYCYGP